MDEIEVVIEDIVRSIRRALTLAHKQGRKEGADQMRAAIFHAAQMPDDIRPRTLLGEARSPTPVQTQPELDPDEEDGQPPSQRAPRGLIYPVLEKILNTHTGLTIKEIEQLVIAAEPRISVKSVGNTLRRLEGITYWRSGDGWHLIRGGSEKNNSAGGTFATTPADDQSTNEGG